ncbi:MAG: hypothetical protein EOP45_15460 [Sphingobacteriaceae bacterium]|nr:MAG: hypothetical protein EOP45_15460 [Sphingobacteriaceae bacterium]
MKITICTLLRATTYIELFAATLMMGSFAYDALLHVEYGIGLLLVLAIITGAALQAIYSITIIRLLYYYAPNYKIPDNSFIHFYNVLAALSVMVAAGLLVWFTVQLVDLLHPFGHQATPGLQKALQLCITGLYTIISLYTIASAGKLKKAILQRKDWQVETWLDEIGRVATV